MRTFIFVSIISISVLTAAFSAVAQTEPSATPVDKGVATLVPKPLVDPGTDDRYLIGFQDVLDVQIFRHPELNLRVTVNPNGKIYLNRLDEPLVAVCKTERQLANDIIAAYKVKYLRDPQVTVTIAEQKSQSLSVIGSVEKPGSYFVGRKVHLLELLAMAGGPNKDAGTRIFVLRTGNSSKCRNPAAGPAENEETALLSFKLRDIQEGKKMFWMQPGDVVSVLDADIVYVYGNVQRQGEIKIREPITLTQAIASASGLKSATKMDRVRILRQKSDSLDREELVFNLNDIDKGKVRDPYLEPNDIVAVSQDSAKNILIGVGNVIKGSAGALLLRVPLP
ncbi:MAG: SLBB domain-containing protein [Acidobacteriota bacterium]